MSPLSFNTVLEVAARAIRQKLKLVTNLTKEVKDLYGENYRTLKKETEDTKRRKDPPCLWISQINVIKTALLLKMVYRFNAIPIEISIIVFTERENIKGPE